jgi:hypothetical protein
MRPFNDNAHMEEPGVRVIGIAPLLSADYGRIAALFAQNAKSVEDNQARSSDDFLNHNAFVYSSIIASAAFLESVINDVFRTLSEERGGRTWAERHHVFSRLWDLGIPRTAPILTKYQVALILTGQGPFDTARNPFQDAHAVIALRNELIHYEPTLQSYEGPEAIDHYPTHKLVARLKGKFPLSAMCTSSAPMWPIKLLSGGCAEWAILQATEFTAAFADRFPIRAISRHVRDLARDARKPLAKKR